jgi:cobalt-zinc-cadmium efflux system protein
MTQSDRRGGDHATLHQHGPRQAGARRLSIVLALAGGYMIVEAVGGVLTNSLALLADAGHMFSDVAALGLALFALRMAQRPATSRHTYGFHRAEILAALLNGATLVAASVYIFIEAFQRFQSPPAVQGAAMMGIASGGLAVNLVGLWILGRRTGESLNERGAWLHVLTDALGSVGAIIGGLAVWKLGWAWADPAVSVLIGLLVVFSSWGLLRESVAVLMEGAPGGLDVDRVRDAMLRIPGVVAVHDLHLWSITSGMVALSAHVRTADAATGSLLLSTLQSHLHDHFGIDHVTIQIEPPGHTEDGTHA